MGCSTETKVRLYSVFCATQRVDNYSRLSRFLRQEKTVPVLLYVSSTTSVLTMIANYAYFYCKQTDL